ESNGFVNALPMLHHRFFPSIEEGSAPSMNELVTMKSYDWEGSDVWTGDAELTFGPSPVEELESLAPVEMIAGYWRNVGVTWGIGTRLA
ncbi:MAG: acetoacetate decarboxylase family protein, partial [Actinomycetota bacterium]